MRSTLLCTIMVLTLAGASYASTIEADLNISAGRSETIDDTDALDLNYLYSKTSAKLSYEISPTLTHTIKLEQSDREYDGDATLNNATLSLKSDLDYMTGTTKEVSGRGLGLNILNKSFYNDPMSDYYQLTLRADGYHKENGSYKLDASGNFRFVDHADPTVENESFLDAKLAFEKYFPGNGFVLDGYSKAITSTSNTYGEQFINRLGAAYKPEVPYLREIDADLTAGVKNSKMDEGVEDDLDLDYRFARISLSSEHPFSDFFYIRLDYLGSSKTYLSGDYDNYGYTGTVSLRLGPLNNFYIRKDITYEEKNYTIVSSLTHVRQYYYLSVAYRIKSDWGLTFALADGIYSFAEAPVKDRIDYLISLTFDRYISDDLSFSVEGNYRMKDYKYESNVNLSSIKAGLNWHL